MPAPHAAAQPSMIEDRRRRRAIPARVIDGENGVVVSKGTASPPHPGLKVIFLIRLPLRSRVRTIGVGHAQLPQAKAMCPFRNPDIRQGARGQA